VECVDSSKCGDQVCDSTSHTCRSCANDSECPNGFCANDTHTCNTTIVPKYLPDICDVPATLTTLEIVADTTLTTSDDAECTMVVTPAAGPPICVLRYGTISIDAAATLKAVGTRALALVADNDVTMAGTLDVSADATLSGPGVVSYSRAVRLRSRASVAVAQDSTRQAARAVT